MSVDTSASDPQSDTAALYCPFPVVLHPRAREIDDSATQWMASCPIPTNPDTRDALLRSRSAAYVACSSPDGIEERLELGGKWYLLAFAVDDWLEELTTLEEVVEACCTMQRIVDDPTAPPLTDLPFVKHFAELIKDFRGSATDVQYARFAAGYTSYHMAIPWETCHRLAGRQVTPAVAPVMRLWVTAFAAFVTASEIYNGMEIPAHEFEAPAVRAWLESAGILLAWCNDIYSVEKDLRSGDAHKNIVMTLMRHHRLDVTHATRKAVEFWNRVMVVHLRLRDRIAVDSSPALNRFLRDTGTMIINVIHWHAGNPRYGGDLALLGIVGQEPPGLDPTPLPIPSIAWWWNH